MLSITHESVVGESESFVAIWNDRAASVEFILHFLNKPTPTFVADSVGAALYVGCTWDGGFRLRSATPDAHASDDKESAERNTVNQDVATITRAHQRSRRTALPFSTAALRAFGLIALDRRGPAKASH